MKLKSYLLNIKSNIFRSLLICYAFAGLAITAVMPGSSLLDLQVLAKVSFTSISTVIAMRSVALFTGGLLGR